MYDTLVKQLRRSARSLDVASLKKWESGKISLAELRRRLIDNNEMTDTDFTEEYVMWWAHSEGYGRNDNEEDI